MVHWFSDLWIWTRDHETHAQEIVCLANSCKNGGRCVAGLRLDGGGWVRPVSTEPEGVLQAWHYTLAGGGEAALLDVLKMRLVCPQPAPHHPENWLMDTGQWEPAARGRSPEVREVLLRSVTNGPELLGGTQSRIEYKALQREPAIESLALVRPHGLHWVIEEGHQGGKRRMRAAFTLAGVAYSLPLTDPVWMKRLASLPCGSHICEANEQGILLTISLSEPFAGDGFCYKLVAAVIMLPPTPTPRSVLERVKLQWRALWAW